MFSSNSHKILFLVFFALLLTASCNFWQDNSEKNKVQNSGSEIQTNIPFSNKEPEVFQAEIIISTFDNGKKSAERKTFVARKQESSLTIYSFETKNEMSYLVIPQSDPLLINHSEKTFQKRIHNVSTSGYDREKERMYLTVYWSDNRNNAKFEKAGTENNLTKYIVTFDNSKLLEVAVFIDEKISFPVKQEFYSVSNDAKVLTMSIEVKNYKTEVDDKLFELPKDYKEIN